MTGYTYGLTRIVVCDNAADLGMHAANEVATVMRRLLEKREGIRMIFAAGESQITFLDALAREPDVDWRRVTCFNMDDFWDPRMPEQFSCGYQTRRQLYDIVRPKAFHLVRFDAPDAEAEAMRFERLMRDHMPFDILCQGIGTSGHLALNEPGDARFDDDRLVRVVDIAEQSKRQLRDDPNFRGLGYIPERGITMTIPAILAAGHIFTMVPLGLKRAIVTRVLDEPEPVTDCPATILSTVPGTLFLDRDSCPEGKVG